MESPVNDDDVTELVRDVWSAAVGIDLHPRRRAADDMGVEVGDTAGAAASAAGPPRAGPEPVGAGLDDLEDAVTGRVAIRGAWNGTVSVAVAASLAEAAAAAMFGMAPAELTPLEIDDALGEVANMIGGGVKALLPGPCQLSLPTVLAGPLDDDEPDVATLRFVDSAGRPVLVTIGSAIEHRPAAV